MNAPQAICMVNAFIYMFCAGYVFAKPYFSEGPAVMMIILAMFTISACGAFS
jgi:hypothetical protein